MACLGEETVPFSEYVPCPAWSSGATLVLLWGCCCTPALSLTAARPLLAVLIAPGFVFVVGSLLLGAQCPPHFALLCTRHGCWQPMVRGLRHGYLTKRFCARHEHGSLLNPMEEEQNFSVPF